MQFMQCNSQRWVPTEDSKGAIRKGKRKKFLMICVRFSKKKTCFRMNIFTGSGSEQLWPEVHTIYCFAEWGTSELTDDQIQYLREMYDVENMSKSDYYNLLAELSGMNVISYKDVENQFLHQDDPAVAAKGFVLIAADEHFPQ